MSMKAIYVNKSFRHGAKVFTAPGEFYLTADLAEYAIKEGFGYDPNAPEPEPESEPEEDEDTFDEEDED